MTDDLHTTPSSAPSAGGGPPRRRNPLDRLVRLLARGGPPGAELASLGGPALVDRLLRAALVAALRRGPRSAEEGWGPARLLEAALAGAAAGSVPVATAARLRATLERLERELREGGFWDPRVPLWWRPLPGRSDLEACWKALDGGGGEGGGAGVRLPPAGELAASLCGGAGWRVVPDALEEGFLARLNGELIAAERDGVLSLTRGGVGQADRRSSERTDRVVYLSGLEPELLDKAPAAATFVQWLLVKSVERLAGGRDTEPGLHAPGSVMLARYRAPCRGFVPHLDNPGGEEDNARAVTLVTYLNAPGAVCNGGEIALWNPAVSAGRSGEAAAGSASEVLPARGGTMVAFDARRVIHEVRSLDEGPDRWTAVLWLSDAPRPAAWGAEPPEPTVGEVLEAVERVPVPGGRVLLRTVGCREGVAADGGAPGPGAGLDVGLQVESVPVSGGRVESGVALACTTHRVGEALERWCRHHLALGVGRLLLVLDETAAPEAAGLARRLARRLARAPGEERIVVWTAEEAAERRRSVAGVQPGFEALERAARAGAATHAVAARQTLNATAALVAARVGELGGGLAWLLHLDADELFCLEGSQRSDRGGRDLAEHFAAAEASGRSLVRYVNHELLLPARPGEPPRFKLNPLLAAVRLGPVGWRRMVAQLGLEQDGPRPYFRAYWNGKSAVRVAAGRAAAGVHGWSLEDGGAGREEEALELMTGPFVLHLHLPTAEAFRDKYLSVAASEVGGERPFPPSPLEERATGLVRELRVVAVGEGELHRQLDALYREALCFGPDEVELLEEAGLVFEAPALEAPYLQAKTGSS